ncbi:hypothetical protein FA10DRAFT_266627 [Acaromyces ingoldii]|uniref:Uncharacterized protein n=1 Tax=Acaromyces ingoldii TaxID=215250 RepID=A0A316YQT0_9BASI|nr:hypothetical protein FA10DRAFT_266627 [Acaromyces ingoldii]PWN90125.1 hypothetical protein FA10DRAFT_266627 [Acaromyces ingoldii]
MHAAAFAALAALATAASAVAHPLTALTRRQDNIPLVYSNTSVVDVGDGLGGPRSLYSCDRANYTFEVVLKEDNVHENNTYRFVFGQPRFGPQGAFIDGNKIFVDHTYKASQILPTVGNATDVVGDTTFFFDMYPEALKNEITSHPWALSTDNNTDGFVVPDLYAVIGYVYFGNGTVLFPGPTYNNVSLLHGRNCTPEFTSTDMKKATQVGGAMATKSIIGLTSFIGAVAVLLTVL